MKILFTRLDTVDCTADPHYASFDCLEEMYETILRVCESDLVWRIEAVSLKMGDNHYESDWYSTYEGKDRKKAEGEYPEKHKVEGLYFAHDAGKYSDKDKEFHHIPPGVSGVKEAIKILLARLKAGESLKGSLYINVVWEFVKDSSCSDHIEVDDLSKATVNFSNQDWWTENEKYPEYLKKLSEVVGVRLSGY